MSLVVKDQPVSFILGESYSVDDSVLDVLDQLEGHSNWYCREQVDVVLDGGSVLSAWLYFSNDNGEVLVEPGKYHFVNT